MSGAPAVAHASVYDPQVVYVDNAGAPVAATTSTTTTVGGGATTTVVTTTQTVHVSSRPAMPPPQPAPQPTVPTKITWIGLSLGAVTSPFSTPGSLKANDRMTTNHFKACLSPGDTRYCSSLRGFDARVQIFNTEGAWDYPRWVGYFRSGYSAGRAEFDPQSGGRYSAGEATSMSYTSVPLFFGGSVYAFKKFPVRPFAGLGVGVDVARVAYTREGQRGLVQTSVRPGFEIHAGIEARISNVVAITFEAQQLWSMRHRVKDLPAFSNSALTLITGISISLPSPGSWHSWGQMSRRPRASAPAYVEPAPTQPAYAQPAYAQPNYAQPNYSQPSWWAPPSTGQPSWTPPDPQQPVSGDPKFQNEFSPPVAAPVVEPAPAVTTTSTTATTTMAPTAVSPQ